MQQEHSDQRSIGNSLEALLRELRDRLPENCATLTTTPGPKSLMIKLVPSNPNAAPICIIVPSDDRDGVTLIAGRGSFFEIPNAGRRYTDLPLVNEVETICSAVIAGRLEEWIVLDDAGDVLRGKGRIELPEPVTVRWRQVSFNPFRRKVKKQLRYEPYRP